jgi:flagellar hook-associated protein 3 FlgL
MRIAGTSYNDSMVAQINLLAAQQYKLQNQASSGQRIQTPEDDPAGMQQALNLQAESSNVAQFTENISTLQARSNTGYGVLQQIQTLSSRAGEIATTVDGTTSPQTTQTYAAEVTQLIQQAAQLMNTKDGDQYLFGGTASGQPPFVVTQDANGNVTGVNYQGNTSVAQSQIGDNTTLSADVPGENTSGSGPRGLVSDSRYGADLFNHLISLQNDLLAGNSTAVSTTDQPSLSKDEDNVAYQVANYGAVQAQLKMASSMASTRTTSLAQNLNTVAGADLAQTLSQLTQANNAYQAALQSASALMQLRQSLLAYLP